MDKALLERIGTGLDATYKPLEQWGGQFEEEGRNLWMTDRAEKIEVQLSIGYSVPWDMWR